MSTLLCFLEERFFVAFSEIFFSFFFFLEGQVDSHEMVLELPLRMQTGKVDLPGWLVDDHTQPKAVDSLLLG